MELYFATGNDSKVKEFKNALESFEVTLKRIDIDLAEMDHEDVEKVSRRKAVDAYNESNIEEPVMVEDSGLYVSALGGFPGSVSSYFFEKCGNHGLLKLLKDIGERDAYFKTSIAIYFPEKDDTKTLSGVCKGRISRKIRGDSGFGYDPVFIPEGRNKTFAEDFSVKEEISHRKKAIEKLKKYLEEKGL